MKENNREQSQNKKLFILYKFFNITTTAYFILLLLAYTFGYYSAAKSTSNSSPVLTTKINDQDVNRVITTQLDNFRVKTQCAAADIIPHDAIRQLILDRVFNDSSPYDNFPPPHIATLLRQRRVKGWGSNGAVFSNLIHKVKPRVIIEVGTFLGASALHMAELTRGLGLQTQILCVDDFRGWPGFRDKLFRDLSMVNGDVLLLQQFLQNVIDSNHTGSILPIPFSTGSVLEKLCLWGVFADLIEIDAGHDFNSAWADINRAYRILRPGGVIFGHDYFTAADNRGVRRAVNLFAELNGELTATKNLESDLYFAYNLQLQEAITASLSTTTTNAAVATQPTPSPPRRDRSLAAFFPDDLQPQLTFSPAVPHFVLNPPNRTDTTKKAKK
ncbi:hypothetical protein ACFE04_019054 [Oxalis oulophora]